MNPLKMANYRRMAMLLQAIENNVKSGNGEWREKHLATLRDLVADAMPSGSGFDNGTRLDYEKSTPEKLIFHTSFHHMNEGGMYDGWTDHTVTVRASLTSRIDLVISGRNRNDIKDFIAETFHTALTDERDI